MPGLHIAVHDAALVRMGERVRHLHGKAQRLADREWRLAPQPIPQRLPSHERHHVVEQPIRLTRVDQHESVRMVELRGDAILPQELLGAHRLGGLAAEHLEGDGPIVLAIRRVEDHAHAAFADRAVDDIAVGEGGLETSGERGVDGGERPPACRAPPFVADFRNTPGTPTRYPNPKLIRSGFG